jgi:hypothetical protein
VLVIATYYNYEIWQMNVKTAFQNMNLYKDVYMTQPKKKFTNKVCKL